MVYQSLVRTAFILFTAIAVCTPQPALAAAWTQAEGQWQINTSAVLYNTSKFFDVNGNLQHQKPLTKTELNPYLEYGLTDDLTLGFNGFIQYFSTSGRLGLRHRGTGHDPFLRGRA